MRVLFENDKVVILEKTNLCGVSYRVEMPKDTALFSDINHVIDYLNYCGLHEEADSLFSGLITARM